MNKENLKRLKKYLFLISLFFSLLISSHIIYIYLYKDAIEIPIEGGSISEGVIGDFPNLNPLLNNNDYNKNIISLLYRSLLKYDENEKSIVPDLANCNLKNLSYIECYLNQNLKWSDGKDITSKDIISTFNIIKNSEINSDINKLLKDTVIEERAGVIIFSNKVKDVNFLQVLFQPIVPKEILDNIGNKELYGKFNPMNGIFSGPYKIDTISYEDALGIQKLILIKNENYKESKVLINKYIFKFFKDENHFLKNKDIVNIFFDQNKIIGDTIPRLNKNTFYLNQYMSLFINEERVKNQDLRNFILEKIDIENILKTLGKGYKEVKNPYIIEGIDLKKGIKNINLESIINEIGYYKKDHLSQILIENSKNETINNLIQKENTTLNYITGPINKKYNFLSKDDILLNGNIKDNIVDEVYINDYKLSSYKKGNKKFYYRLKENLNNIKTGENHYKIYFLISGEKKLVEEFYVIYNKNEEELKLQEKTYFENKFKPNKTININEEQKQKILSLDDKYYYNKDLNRFNLRLYYIDIHKELPQVVNIIKNSLDTYGIHVDTIPISISELNSKILSGEKDYDLIIVGIDLGYFDFNIYPYFHSSQAKSGYNFSNIKNLNLDILLEELKSNVLTKTKRIEIQKRVIDIIREKQIVKTLYSKENIYLVDKNIKSFNLNSKLSSPSGITQSIINSYVVSDKQINFDNKNIKNFIKFIKNIIKNEG